MSVVTNVIITGLPGLYPEQADRERPSFNACVIDAMNKLLTTPDEDGHAMSRSGLTECSDHAGGTKYMEMHVWLGAFNYLPINKFVACWQEVVKRLEKYNDENRVQLMICRQGDSQFETVPNVDDGRDWSYNTRDNDTLVRMTE